MGALLYAVALVTCMAPGECTVDVLEKEVYKSEQDCENRRVHLEKINPGKEFLCGTVYRRKP